MVTPYTEYVSPLILPPPPPPSSLLLLLLLLLFTVNVLLWIWCHQSDIRYFIYKMMKNIALICYGLHPQFLIIKSKYLLSSYDKKKKKTCKNSFLNFISSSNHFAKQVWITEWLVLHFGDFQPKMRRHSIDASNIFKEREK